MSVGAEMSARARRVPLGPASETVLHEIFRPPAASAAILLFAAALQIHFGAFGDVSWIITICEGWLDGKRLYVDFFETNTPAAVALYLPPTWFARLAHLRPEAVVATYGLFAASGALAYTLAIARSAGVIADSSGFATVVGLVVLTLMPGRTFDERDFFALVLLLPSIAFAAARAAPGRVNAVDAAFTALGLAFAVAIKPPYAAIPALLFLHLAFRVGIANALKCAEFYLAAAFFALIVIVSWLAFPEYFRDVLPTISLAYVPVREPMATLIANAGVVAFLALGALIALVCGRRATAPLPASFALAAFGALIAYFVQGKGWLYHIYPALALIALAYAAASGHRPRDRLLSVLAALAAAAPLIGALLFDLPPLPTAAVAALVAWLYATRYAGRETRESLARLAGGALIGACCGLYCGAFPGASPPSSTP